VFRDFRGKISVCCCASSSSSSDAVLRPVLVPCLIYPDFMFSDGSPKRRFPVVGRNAYWLMKPPGTSLPLCLVDLIILPIIHHLWGDSGAGRLQARNIACFLAANKVVWEQGIICTLILVCDFLLAEREFVDF